MTDGPRYGSSIPIAGIHLDKKRGSSAFYRIQTQQLSITLTSVAFAGCASLNKKEKGAIIGAAAGGAVGGLIGKNNGSTAKGAIIGAAVGGTVGAVIGHQMDQQAKELKQNIPGAVVERVGEGSSDVRLGSSVRLQPEAIRAAALRISGISRPASRSIPRRTS